LIKAIIFDYNQVIVNDQYVHLLAYKKTFKELGVNISESELIEIMPRSHIEKLEILKIKYNLDIDIKKLFVDKEKMYLKIANETDLLFPDAKKILNKLSKKYVLAIVTGTTKAQLFGVLPSDVLKLFNFILTIEDYKKPKPDPESIILGIKKLGFNFNECVYVGDAKNDMVTARQAGCVAIGITTGNASKEELEQSGAEKVVVSLTDLLDKIK